MSGLRTARSGCRIKLLPASNAAGGEVIRLPAFVDLFGRANGIASEFADRIDDPFWRLEYAKLIAADGFAVLGQARKIVETAVSGAPANTFSNVMDMDRVRFACAHELATRGYDVAGAYRARIFARLRFCASAAVAFGFFACTVLRHGWRNRLATVAGAGPLVAVHGEISNRTHHVLAAAGEPGACQGIILLGRPKSGLGSLRTRFDAEFGLSGMPLYRPISPGAMLRSLPRWFRLVRSGINIAPATGYKARWRDEIATLYRMCAGACAADWWVRQKAAPGIVVFGHTGLADTSMLEAAQQSAGSRTVHWAHGLSGGWNFAGLSDFCLFRCGYDVETHARLPAYRETGYFQLPMPDYVPSHEGGWLLLTNYAHLTNPFASHGACDIEAEVVRMTAEAAEQTGVGADRLHWRPHPVFWLLPNDLRERVLASVSGTGITMPVPNSPMPVYDDYKIILCTFSTMPVEILADGRLPIIVAPHDIPAEMPFGAFPLVGSNAGQLIDAVGRLDDRKAAADLFAQAWNRVRPADPEVSLERIVQRVSR